MSRPPVLEILGLHIRRDETQVLQDVAWTVQPGEHWVILGANGSGKTSLLKVLTGLMSPTAGQIRVDGQRYGATDWRQVRRTIGLVSSALQMHVPANELALETVISGRYDQLDLWAPVTAADRRAARDELRALGIGKLANRPWAYLSQGERQRVLIARALVARPRLLILDEPCAGLDPVARVDFLAGVERLARSPRAPTLVFVTHHVEEIMPAFTHVLILAEGRVAAAGPRDDVLTSATLSRAFGRALRLRRSRSGWSLTVAQGSAS